MNTRIRIMLFFVLCLWVIVIAKLYYVQVSENQHFQNLASNQQGLSERIYDSRGIISSSDGIELAINVPLYDSYIYTPNINNSNDFKKNILPLLGLTVASFDQHISSGETYFLASSQVSPSVKQQIMTQTGNENQNSIVFNFYEKRYYPQNSLLSQSLGFFNEGAVEGEYGIEGYFNADLNGFSGIVQSNKDQTGNLILNQNFSFSPPVPGEDINLTVNSYIQKIVEDKLKYWVDKEEANSGSVIIMNPSTGAIIAMANYPTFDPNKYSQGYIIDCSNYTFINEPVCKSSNGSISSSILDSSFNNNAISYLYEPGSVMKAITASAALQTGKITPNTTFNDSTGYFQANGAKIYNYNKLPDGVMNMAQILNLSSNVGASMVSSLLGAKDLYDYYSKFGIGQLTGITLNSEQTAILPNYKNWQQIDTATASFGQYVAATPLQVLSVYQTIANNGIRMEPYIIKSIDKNGVKINYTPKELSTVLSKSNANELTQMLTYATTGEPTYALTTLHATSYTSLIAGKTGSAQIPFPNKRGYYPNEINTTFVGYSPPTNPSFVMIAFMQDPRGGLYASTTVVPLWVDIAKYLFNYFKIAP